MTRLEAGLLLRDESQWTPQHQDKRMTLSSKTETAESRLLGMHGACTPHPTYSCRHI